MTSGRVNLPEKGKEETSEGTALQACGTAAVKPLGREERGCPAPPPAALPPCSFFSRALITICHALDLSCPCAYCLLS